MSRLLVKGLIVPLKTLDTVYSLSLISQYIALNKMFALNIKMQILSMVKIGSPESFCFLHQITYMILSITSTKILVKHW